MDSYKTSMMWILFVTCLHLAMATRASYRAAVYEHVIMSPANPAAEFTREEAFMFMSQNLDIYEEQIAIAAKKGVDIIVFPEYGVTGFDQSRDSLVPFLEDVPDPELDWTPCNDPDRFPDTNVLHRLSCLAKQYDIYIVANIGDIKKCSEDDITCPPDGRYQLNTNVVFDSKGKLTARYHKLNLYDEQTIFNPAPAPQYVTFDTPFGHFGTVVCFDLMHYYPTQVLLSDSKVQNLLVTSAWNVFYPFVLSTQMYSGISKYNQVNVIAANARNDSYLMAGSGIFGADVSVLSDPDYQSDNGVLLIADLNSNAYEGSDPGIRTLEPIYSHKSTMKDTNVTYHGNYEYGMNMSFVELTEDRSSAVVCDETICCAVHYEFDVRAPREVFIVSASDFAMDYPGQVHLQLCAVHSCQNENLYSCGVGVPFTRSTFKYIKLQAFFNQNVVFPIVSASPFNNITIRTEKDNYYFDPEHAIIESKTLREPLHAFVLLNTITEYEYNEPTRSSVEPKLGASRNGLALVTLSLSLQNVCTMVIMVLGVLTF